MNILIHLDKSKHLDILPRVNDICDCRLKLGLPTEIQAKMNSKQALLKARLELEINYTKVVPCPIS